MKTQFEKIKVAYVVNMRYERIRDMFTGRTRTEAVPDGSQHIFEVETDAQGNESLAARSFCGMGKGDIGENAKECKNRQPGGVCEKCSAAWKTDPRSSWAAWSKGEKVGAQ